MVETVLSFFRHCTINSAGHGILKTSILNQIKDCQQIDLCQVTPSPQMASRGLFDFTTAAHDNHDNVIGLTLSSENWNLF